MSLQERLLGRDPVLSVVAPLAGLLVGGLLWQSRRGLLEGYSLLPDGPGDWLLLAVLVGVPAAMSVWNDGLVVCWSFDFGLLVAAYLERFFPRLEEALPPDPYASLLASIALAVAGAVLWGSVGFLVGVGSRRLVLNVRSWWLRRSVG